MAKRRQRRGGKDSFLSEDYFGGDRGPERDHPSSGYKNPKVNPTPDPGPFRNRGPVTGTGLYIPADGSEEIGRL